jgi:hypothetical protein
MSKITLRSVDESILPTTGEFQYDETLLQTALAVGDACMQLTSDDTPRGHLLPDEGPVAVPFTILSENKYGPYHANFATKGKYLYGRSKVHLPKLMEQGHTLMASSHALGIISEPPLPLVNNTHLSAIEGATTHAIKSPFSTSQITGVSIENPYLFNKMAAREKLPHPLNQKRGKALIDLIISIANTPADIEAIQANIDNWPTAA